MSSSPTPSPTPCIKTCPLLKYYSNGVGNFLSNLGVYGVYDGITNSGGTTNSGRCVYNYNGLYPNGATGPNLNTINSLQKYNPSNLRVNLGNSNSTPTGGSTTARTWTVDCPYDSTCSSNQCW